VKDMFPNHNTAASIANTFSWSSLPMWTTSRASWKLAMVYSFLCQAEKGNHSRVYGGRSSLNYRDCIP